MRFTTGELESVPILLAQRLANDVEEWTVQVFDRDDDLLVQGVVDPRTDWHHVVVSSPSGNDVKIHWDDVGTVHVP